MRSTRKRWFAFGALVFALNFAWEMSQARWFASMRDVPFWAATYLCARAAFGDLVIAAISFAAAAALARSVTWPLQHRAVFSSGAFILVGLAIVVVYELVALRTGMWQYAETMPTLFGIGALPILQWLALPICEVGLFRVLGRR